MTKINASVLVDANRERVWSVLADFGNVYRMSPGVKFSYLTSDQTVGEGTTRHCDLSLMNATVEERITKFQAPEHMEIDIYEWKKLPFMRRIGGEFSLTDLGDKTRLDGVFWYELTRNPIGHMANALMMKRVNTKAWVEALAGIKYYAETCSEGESCLSVESTDLDLSTVST